MTGRSLDLRALVHQRTRCYRTIGPHTHECDARYAVLVRVRDEALREGYARECYCYEKEADQAPGWRCGNCVELGQPPDGATP